MLSARAGIEITGLMAYTNEAADEDGEYRVMIMRKITAQDNTLSQNATIKVNFHNVKGQVCGTSETHVSSDDFFGMETLDISVYSKGMPVEIKLPPKASA